MKGGKQNNKHQLQNDAIFIMFLLITDTNLWLTLVLVSSAYDVTLAYFNQYCRSATYVMFNRGDKMPPCGTPHCSDCFNDMIILLKTVLMV